MNWEKLIISPKSSQLVKEKLFEQKNSCKLFNSKEFANQLSRQLSDIANNKR